MKYGLQTKHKDLGQQLSYEREGKPTIVGICDRVEIMPANWRNINTSKKIAKASIRIRLKPLNGGRAVWTDRFPFKPQPRKAA